MNSYYFPEVKRSPRFHGGIGSLEGQASLKRLPDPQRFKVGRDQHQQEHGAGEQTQTKNTFTTQPSVPVPRPTQQNRLLKDDLSIRVLSEQMRSQIFSLVVTWTMQTGVVFTKGGGSSKANQITPIPSKLLKQCVDWLE